MSGAAFILGGVLPYFTLIAFVAGMGHRVYVWLRTPQPAKITLYPAPEGSLVPGVLAEAFFFPSLFKADKALWSFAWLFHASLALILVGHLRVVTGLIDRMLMALGVSQGGIDFMSSSMGGAAGVVILATAVLLLVRRVTSRRVREITQVSDFVALLLVVAVIATGDLMRFGAHFDLAQTRAWAWSLLTFSPVIPENGMFLLHATLGQMLFMYIPFSKILHLGGVFFTHALLQRR